MHLENKSFEKVDLLNTYKYYSWYNNRSEEEHKIDKWVDSLTFAFSSLFHKLIIHKDDFRLFMKFDLDSDKGYQTLRKFLSAKGVVVKTHKIMNGDFYFENQSSNIFERFFSKAKEWFVGISYEHDKNLLEDAKKLPCMN